MRAIRTMVNDALSAMRQRPSNAGRGSSRTTEWSQSWVVLAERDVDGITVEVVLKDGATVAMRSADVAD